jgi:hypothetical protein
VACHHAATDEVTAAAVVIAAVIIVVVVVVTVRSDEVEPKSTAVEPMMKAATVEASKAATANS